MLGSVFIDIENCVERTSIWSASETYLPMPQEVSDALYGPGSYRYLQEVCFKFYAGIFLLFGMIFMKLGFIFVLDK